MVSSGQARKQEVKSAKKYSFARDAVISCIEASYCGVFSDPENGPSEVEFFKQFAIKPCKCDSQWCPDCRLAHCVRWRERLRPVIEAWEAVRMVTLTIDRKKWKSPEACYEGVQKRRSVAEFVKKLHRKRVGLVSSREFFYVIEFHPSSPDWVHWHAAIRPRGHWPNRGDRGWNVFQDRLSELWGHGFAVASDSHDTSSPVHAMHYLTKYIAKQDVEPPQWVMQREGNFRKFSTSRGLCGVSKVKEDKKTGRKNEKNTPAQRVAKCRQSSKVFKLNTCEVRTIGKTEKKRDLKSVGKLEVPFDELDKHPAAVRAALRGDLDAAAKALDPTWCK